MDSENNFQQSEFGGQPSTDGATTLQLRAWQEGSSATTTFFNFILPDLNRIVLSSFSRFRNVKADCDPGDVLSLLWLKLLPYRKRWRFVNSKHFFSLVHPMSRHLFLDLNKSLETEKRGGGLRRVSLERVDREARLGIGETHKYEVRDIALKKLRAKYRREFEMMKLLGEGKSHQEIAEMFRVSEEDVRAAQKQAQDFLRRHSEGE